ncbi:MAG: hypothetical protein A4E72_01610 [Syntrophus sp. PtaU1.Bin208]|nr:MAG: hypothetical protein A4E72_01610 [Syntrophus sp. PtaU1.Bin208]
MEIDIPEGDVVHDVFPHHHHPCHPEEEDVKAGNEQRGGIKGLQGLGLIRPAQGGKRPEGGAEPGIQDVLLLTEGGIPAIGTGIGILGGDDHFAAGIAMPDGDAVPPPDLAGDAPIPDVVHPLVIGRFPHGGNNSRFSFDHGADGRLCQRLDLYEPLLGNGRFNVGLAAITLSHVVHVRFNADQVTLLFQIGHDVLPAFVTVLSLVGAAVFVDGGAAVHDVDDFQ